MQRRNNHQFDPFSGSADDYGPPPDLDFNDPAAIAAALSVVPPKMATPAEVRQEAKDRRDRMFDSFRTLRQILERHEATVQKRWLKKTRQQRLQILLQAWPNMAASHRPDFHAFRKGYRNGRYADAARYREHFMWPYINQEDLVKPRALLLLLNARGRSPPSAFAAADGEAMHVGKVTSAIMPVFLNEYVMLMNGVVAPADYGKLVSWDDHPDAFEWMYTRAQLLPGEGLLILEAQERLLAFLVACCQQTLHEIEPAQLVGDAYPVQPEPQLKTEADIAGFDSLAVLAAEAPYRLPAKLDLGRIVSLLDARASAAADHVWALREDPSYFADRLLEARDHRLESLKDTDNKDHPTTAPLRQHILWARVIGSVVTEAYLPHEVFAELLVQARELQALQQQYAASIAPDKPLPEEYLAAILRFYAREPPPNPTTSKIVAVAKPGDEKPLFFLGLANVIDELERLLAVERPAKDFVSAYVASVVGDLSILSQCLHQLDLYQPWANGFESKAAERQEDIADEFGRRTAAWGKMVAALAETNLTEAAKLGAPTGGRFTYPFEKRRTKDNTAVLQQAERHLDAFWASIDRLLYVKADNLQGTATRRLLTLPRIVQRTPNWVDKPQPAPTTSGPTSGKAGAGEATAVAQPLSPFYSRLGSDKPTFSRSDVTLPSRPKTKTRGPSHQSGHEAATAATAATAAATAAAAEQADRQPTFAVDARALKVFRTLFFNPDTTSTPGEVPWNDFLHAMASTGFSAEKLYGSVWQFRPTRLDIERSIQIHEPHPQSKLPFVRARCIGRRLHRAYGWFGGMFVLAEK
ncbi:hypothetical protein SPI_05774 [Niveomyces insectorum RCEF 264]|uniref:Uncharacterized protein n=1 Tax=Niveomyces insectorum RCEF 264 TaxID=1081102 RepID=A0A167SFC7_9HYPO|nr:hypothetical protein SPI_05774 [Niveomyces insectorum RCEF 264]